MIQRKNKIEIDWYLYLGHLDVKAIVLQYLESMGHKVKELDFLTDGPFRGAKVKVDNPKGGK